MKLAFLTLVTMMAFAANSLLNRAALAGEAIDPGSFALIRVAAGAVTLLILLSIRSGGLPRVPRPNAIAVLALTAYLAGFSFAYVALNAGLGALILFGGVQITMFAGAVVEGDRPPLARWLGMAVSLAGLAWLVLPGFHGSTSGGLALLPVTLMAAAAIGWGVYSLIGRRAGDPLAATAWNFAYALPAVAVIAVLSGIKAPTGPGIILAILSGAVTSGLGYALWYALLPALGATRAAVAQLSVPVLALVAGALLLGEAITPRAAFASALILGGIALGILPSMRRAEV